MADLLVTGTDTGVGKTVIAAAAVLALRDRGVRAVAWKPAQSGIGDEAPSDAAVLAAASGTSEPLAEPLLSLPEPLAPAVAAERACVHVEPEAFRERVRALRGLGYTVVVEGAGGLLVPLVWGFGALDLAAELGLEAVIVARAGLGTLNHVALTAEALRARGVALRGIVLNGRSVPPDLAEETNPAALARLVAGVPIVTVPRHPTADALQAARLTAPLLKFV
jgi:dethiobiotin synthetase